MVNAKRENNMSDLRKVWGSILTTTFHIYFLKLYSDNYTLPLLIERSNSGVIFFFVHSLHSFPRYFWGKSSAGDSDSVRNSAES